MGATRPLDRGKPLPKMSLTTITPYEDENVMEKSWMILIFMQPLLGLPFLPKEAIYRQTCRGQSVNG